MKDTQVLRRIKIVFKIPEVQIDKNIVITLFSFSVPPNKNLIPVEDLMKYGVKKKINILCEEIFFVKDEFAKEYIAEVSEEQLKELLDFN